MRPIVLAIALLAAPAAAQKPAPATEPPKVGTYDLELTTNEGTLVAQLDVARSGDAHTARVTVMGHSPETRSFVREGGAYVLTAARNAGTVVYTLAFAGDSLRGAFRMSTGGAGAVAGKLRR
jgi:hypothetical protein